MDFISRCHNWSFRKKNNIYHHLETTKLSVSAPLKDCSIRGRAFCIENIRNSFPGCPPMYRHRHNFVVNNTSKNKRHRHQNFELKFVSIQTWKTLGHTSRETKLFVLQKEYSARDTWTSIEEIDSHFCWKNENYFNEGKVSQNRFRSDSKLSQHV